MGECFFISSRNWCESWTDTLPVNRVGLFTLMTMARVYHHQQILEVAHRDRPEGLVRTRRMGLEVWKER
jgi:hypothetical protein